MLKIKQINIYPAAVKYQVYFDDTNGEFNLFNNLDEAIEALCKHEYEELSPQHIQDVVTFSTLLLRTGFYLGNDFKPTDMHSPNPLRVYKQAMELKERLIQYFQGDLKFPPARMEQVKATLQNIQELSLKVVKK